jgi:hypothetical protein
MSRTPGLSLFVNSVRHTQPALDRGFQSDGNVYTTGRASFDDAAIFRTTRLDAATSPGRRLACSREF